MAWSTPLTAVSNVALTAAQWNASVRDNMLVTPAALATQSGQIFASTAANAIVARYPDTATVNTAETTGGTGYGALATAGPVVTSTTGVRALVIINAQVANNTTGANAYMSYAVSGATSFVSSDSYCVMHRGNANDSMQASYVHFRVDLTGGSNTFTAQYRVSSGTGTFTDRRLQILPF